MKKRNPAAACAARRMGKLTVIAAAAAMSTAVYAGETIEFANGVKIDWTASVGYTAAWRLEDPSPKLSGAANASGDDGNLNFKKRAMVNNLVNVLGQADIQKDRSGFFIRASSFYDDVYHRSNDNPGGTLNTFQPANQFTSDARKYAGGRTRLLESYGYTTVGLGGESTANLRLGRHVVAWGEAFYYPTMATSQVPVDVTRALIPGTEAKEIFLPVNQFSANVQVNKNWSVIGYTQFDSNKTELPPVGAYLWNVDLMGPGAVCVTPVMTLPGGAKICPFGQRTADQKAKRSGQWGIGTRYRLTDADEVGLYHFNYHDRGGLPVFTFASPTSATYRIKYFEDIRVTGLTYSTRLGEWQFSAEAAYKDGLPVNAFEGITKLTVPTRAKATQWTLAGYRLLGNNPISDNATIIAEISGRHLRSVERANLEGVLPLPPTSTLAESNSKNAMAATISVELGYKGIFPGWDLDVPLSYQRQLQGAGGYLYGKGDTRVGVGVKFKYLGNLQVGLNYYGFLGSKEASGPRAHPLADRDFIQASLKYNF